MLRSTACVVFALAATGPSAAQTQERPIEVALQVRGSDGGCIDQRSLSHRLTHWLGGRGVAADARIELRLWPGPPPGANLTLHRANHPPAQRVFPSLEGRCADRIDAIALALAIALDPEAVARRVEEQTEAPFAQQQQGDGRDHESAPSDSVEAHEAGEAGEHVLADASESPTSEPSPAPEGSVERRFGVALGGGIVWGWLEASAPLATLAIDLHFRPRLTLRTALSLTGERDSPVGTGRYGARLVSGELTLRAGVSFGQIRLEGGLALIAGAVLARGLGFADDRRTRRPWVAFAVGPRAELALSSAWAISLAAEAVIALLRARVHVMDANGRTVDSRTTPAAGLRVILEVIARF